MNDLSFEATITHLSHKGLAVVKHPDGRSFFCRGVWPGDKARFKLAPDQKNFDLISLEVILSSNIERESNLCPHRGDKEGLCGGCPWMDIPYSDQLKAKNQRIDFILSKNNLKTDILKPIIASPKIFGYRNRAQFKTDGNQLGFVSEGSNTIAPIQECRVLNPAMQTLLHKALCFLPKKEWQSGNEKWNYIEVDDQYDLNTFALNQRRPFRQGNEDQNMAMKNWIKAALQSMPKNLPIIELFAGSGNFTEVLSELGFNNILATEIRGSAIEELERKKIPGVRALAIDMNTKGVWSQIAKQQTLAKILLVDPPRDGIMNRKGLFDHLRHLEMMLYISCEPNTWARDMKDFVALGWKIQEITPLDLFPHTPHVEILSILVKN